MLTDVKTWLEATGYPVERLLFKEPPDLPYIIFTETVNATGADDKNLIAERAIRVELYSETINETAEGKIEALLNAIEYTKEQLWIESQLLHETIYSFDLKEKI